MRRAAALLIAVLLLAGRPARAHENVWVPREDNAAWRSECSGCHMAYPPALLTAAEWLFIMARLDQHYGVDASLERALREEITNYLDRNGVGRSWNAPGPELPRITGSERFVEKHRSAIRLWNKGRIQSLGDCAACHKTGPVPAQPPDAAAGGGSR